MGSIIFLSQTCHRHHQPQSKNLFFIKFLHIPVITGINNLVIRIYYINVNIEKINFDLKKKGTGSI